MQVMLDASAAAEPAVPKEVMGQKIIALARDLIDDGALADWLRDRA